MNFRDWFGTFTTNIINLFNKIKFKIFTYYHKIFSKSQNNKFYLTFTK